MDFFNFRELKKFKMGQTKELKNYAIHFGTGKEETVFKYPGMMSFAEVAINLEFAELDETQITKIRTYEKRPELGLIENDLKFLQWADKYNKISSNNYLTDADKASHKRLVQYGLIAVNYGGGSYYVSPKGKEYLNAE